ncbi:MAG: hypothetical protein INH41_26270 [Myxococcaceae bacterium]|nr:hypothetical protein [Myxococcaceae bacterium]MCA3015905.1 hypothetical protein [Myxococcaceae bacterium]
MNVIAVYARLYARALTDALAAIAKNPWTLLLPMGLSVAWLALGLLLGSLLDPYSGGFLIGLARSASLSVYCFFLGGLVANQKVGLDQLKTSLGAYFWSWIGIFFVLWVVDLVLSPLFAANQNLVLPFTLVKFVALNATPEVVYQKGTRGGLDTLTRSFGFLQENWIEWFVPNGLFVAAFVIVSRFGDLAVAALGLLGAGGLALAGGALLHVVMVFRGFLFEALDGSSHRQRMFRYRGG